MATYYYGPGENPYPLGPYLPREPIKRPDRPILYGPGEYPYPLGPYLPRELIKRPDRPIPYGPPAPIPYGPPAPIPYDPPATKPPNSPNSPSPSKPPSPPKPPPPPPPPKKPKRPLVLPKQQYDLEPGDENVDAGESFFRIKYKDGPEFYFGLLPAITTGYGDVNGAALRAVGVPEVRPGIIFNSKMRVRNHIVPGSQPALQMLGIEKTEFILIGRLIGNELDAPKEPRDKNHPEEMYSADAPNLLNHKGGEGYMNAYASALFIREQIIQRGKPVLLTIHACETKYGFGEKKIIPKIKIERQVVLTSMREYLRWQNCDYYILEGFVVNYIKEDGEHNKWKQEWIPSDINQNTPLNKRYDKKSGQTPPKPDNNPSDAPEGYPLWMDALQDFLTGDRRPDIERRVAGDILDPIIKASGLPIPNPFTSPPRPTPPPNLKPGNWG